jgi:hypothetical protein
VLTSLQSIYPTLPPKKNRNSVRSSTSSSSSSSSSINEQDIHASVLSLTTEGVQQIIKLYRQTSQDHRSTLFLAPHRSWVVGILKLPHSRVCLHSHQKTHDNPYFSFNLWAVYTDQTKSSVHVYYRCNSSQCRIIRKIEIGRLTGLVRLRAFVAERERSVDQLQYKCLVQGGMYVGNQNVVVDEPQQSPPNPTAVIHTLERWQTSFLPGNNYTHSFDLVNERVQRLEWDTARDQVLVVCAGFGGGKTTQVFLLLLWFINQHFLRESSIIITVCRLSLGYRCEELGLRLTGHPFKYLCHETAKSRNWMKYPYVICEVESLQKLNGRRFDVVVGCEMTQTFHNFQSSSMYNTTFKQVLLFVLEY